MKRTYRRLVGWVNHCVVQTNYCFPTLRTSAINGNMIAFWDCYFSEKTPIVLEGNVFEDLEFIFAFEI